MSVEQRLADLELKVSQIITWIKTTDAKRLGPIIKVLNNHTRALKAIEAKNAEQPVITAESATT